MDVIELKGLSATGYHGVFEHERREGQTFVVDLKLFTDLRPAAKSDDLADTVDYGAVAIAVCDVIRGEPFDLIETLAQRIADAVLGLYEFEKIQVTVHKPQAPITEVFADVSVTILRSHRPAWFMDLASAAAPVPRNHAVVLGLGANLGNPEDTLRQAVERIRRWPTTELFRSSSIWRTAPVGGPEDQPEYANGAVAIMTDLTPAEVLARAQQLEADFGRERIERWGPRTLDVDILLIDRLRLGEPELTVPHPRLHERAFVLAPLLELDAYGGSIAPDGTFRQWADLLAEAGDRDTVRKAGPLDGESALASRLTSTGPNPEEV